MPAHYEALSVSCHAGVAPHIGIVNQRPRSSRKTRTCTARRLHIRTRHCRRIEPRPSLWKAVAALIPAGRCASDRESMLTQVECAERECLKDQRRLQKRESQAHEGAWANATNEPRAWERPAWHLQTRHSGLPMHQMSWARAECCAPTSCPKTAKVKCDGARAQHSATNLLLFFSVFFASGFSRLC